MAKLISGKTKITIENAAGAPMHFETERVNISSTDGGRYYSIVMAPAKKAGWPSCADTKGYSIDGKDAESLPSPEAVAMIEAAQRAEQAVLGAAHDLQVAQRAAKARVEDANHRLNMAILSFMQTGKTNLDASKVLEASGIYATEDRTEAVACAQMDRLYGVDTPDTGV